MCENGLMENIRNGSGIPITPLISSENNFDGYENISVCDGADDGTKNPKDPINIQMHLQESYEAVLRNQLQRLKDQKRDLEIRLEKLNGDIKKEQAVAGAYVTKNESDFKEFPGCNPRVLHVELDPLPVRSSKSIPTVKLRNHTAKSSLIFAQSTSNMPRQLRISRAMNSVSSHSIIFLRKPLSISNDQESAASLQAFKFNITPQLGKSCSESETVAGDADNSSTCSSKNGSDESLGLRTNSLPANDIWWESELNLNKETGLRRVRRRFSPSNHFDVVDYRYVEQSNLPQFVHLRHSSTGTSLHEPLPWIYQIEDAYSEQDASNIPISVEPLEDPISNISNLQQEESDMNFLEFQLQPFPSLEADYEVHGQLPEHPFSNRSDSRIGRAAVFHAVMAYMNTGQRPSSPTTPFSGDPSYSNILDSASQQFGPQVNSRLTTASAGSTAEPLISASDNSLDLATDASNCEISDGTYLPENLNSEFDDFDSSDNSESIWEDLTNSPRSSSSSEYENEDSVIDSSEDEDDLFMVIRGFRVNADDLPDFTDVGNGDSREIDDEGLPLSIAPSRESMRNSIEILNRNVALSTTSLGINISPSNVSLLRSRTYNFRNTDRPRAFSGHKYVVSSFGLLSRSQNINTTISTADKLQDVLNQYLAETPSNSTRNVSIQTNSHILLIDANYSQNSSLAQYHKNQFFSTNAVGKAPEEVYATTSKSDITATGLEPHEISIPPNDLRQPSADIMVDTMVLSNNSETRKECSDGRKRPKIAKKIKKGKAGRFLACCGR